MRHVHDVIHDVMGATACAVIASDPGDLIDVTRYEGEEWRIIMHAYRIHHHRTGWEMAPPMARALAARAVQRRQGRARAQLPRLWLPRLMGADLALVVLHGEALGQCAAGRLLMPRHWPLHDESQGAALRAALGAP